MPRKPVCHPERVHCGYGLCSVCYRLKRLQEPNYTRNKSLWERYRIKTDDYERLAQQQNNVCAICLKPTTQKYLVVDHCHTTKKIRGLLCNACNGYLGKVEKDISILSRIFDHLTYYRNEPAII
jgi:hypothetical protein